MNIGVAIVVVAIMYFIDKHSLWRRFAICLGIIAVVALLGLGGFWRWTTYRDVRDKKAFAEFNKKWAAEIPACNGRNIKNYFAAQDAVVKPTLPPGYELEQSIPLSTMEDIKKSCSADPYKYVWNSQLKFGETEECLDGTNLPCLLVSDGRGNLLPIPKGQAKDDAKKASK